VKLLFLLPFPPDPRGTHGASRMTGQLLSHAAERHEVAAVYLRAADEQPIDPRLESELAFAIEIRRPPLAGPLRRGLGLLRGRPTWVTDWAVPELGRRARAAAAEWRPDVVQAELSVMGQYLDGFATTTVLVDHDPGAATAAELAEWERGARGIGRRLDAAAWRRYERRAFGAAGAVVVFSDEDRERIAERAPRERVERIAPGAPHARDAESERPAAGGGERPAAVGRQAAGGDRRPVVGEAAAGPSVVFVGGFGHPPNVEAALRLAGSIFPAVRRRVPAATLELVGADPPAALRALGRPGIAVTGRVPDAQVHVERAAVVVAPLRLGGGVRVKVLDALAAGKPLVATARALAGLDLTPGEHALVGETDAELADALVALLDDPERARRIGAAGKERASDQLRWERALDEYDRLYATLAQRSRPRVALVGWRLGGELERVIREGRERFDFSVVSMDLDPELRSQVDWRPLPKPPFGSFRLGWIAFFTRGGRRVARLDADLVHTVGPLPVVPNRVSLNTVTFCHAAYDRATAGNPLKGSSSSVGWRLGQRLALGLERWWFRRGPGTLVAISEGSAADLRRLYPQARVAVMPRGIDLARFRPDADDRRRFRAEQRTPADAVVALFVDQQHRPLKGLDIAIEAMAAARARDAGPDQLWVVGAGSEPYAELAARLGVADRVRFLGFTDEVERCYRAADLFVLPTVYEAFCRAAHEAAACGLPLVAPPVNGIRELVGSDEAGLIVERRPAAVADALVALTADPDARRRKGEVARRRAQAFDERAVAGRILDLYGSMLR